MKMQFEVTYLDGRKVESTAGPKDLVAFERQYDKSIAGFADADGLRMEWIYYLAWSPLHREGREAGDFDSFLTAVDEVSPVESTEPVDPTQAAVIAAPLSA